MTQLSAGINLGDFVDSGLMDSFDVYTGGPITEYIKDGDIVDIFYELDFIPTGENRLSILMDGYKRTLPEGVITVPEALVATAQLYIYDDYLLDAEGLWSLVNLFDPIEAMSLEDSILQGIYGSEFPFLQFDTSELVLEAGQRLILGFTATEADYIGASERILITTGLPNGQRGEQWGDWLEERGTGAQTEEEKINDYFEDQFYEPARFEQNDPLEDFANKAYQFSSPTFKLYSFYDPLSQGDWQAGYGVPDDSPFIAKESGAGGGAGIFASVSDDIVGATIEAVRLRAGQTTVGKILGAGAVVQDFKNFQTALRTAADNLLDSLGRALNGEDIDLDALGNDTSLSVISGSSFTGANTFFEVAQKTSLSISYSQGLYSFSGQPEQWRYTTVQTQMGDGERKIEFPDPIVPQEGVLEYNTTYLGAATADKVSTSIGDDVIYGFTGNDTVHAGSGADTLFGGEGRDELYGEGQNDRLFGGSYDDILYGGGGRDRLFGGLQGDSLYGQNGRDFLKGGAGKDKLFGGAGGDHLDGGKGRDRLNGGDGDDWLSGGGGRDVLRGGKGIDTFSFDAAHVAGFDIIRDFAAGVDILEISGAGAESVRIISSRGGVDTTITIADDKAVVLRDVDVSLVILDDFSFV